MPKFTFFASETVHYAFDIEAANEEEAVQKALDYDLSFDDVTEAENFQIKFFEENTDA